MEKDKLPIWLLLSVILAFGVVGAFARIMVSLDHNEHMYIAASVLVSQGDALYQDFSYLQTPYLPILYGTLFRLLGISSFYLLTGKLMSFLSLGLSSIALFLLARRVLDDVALSLGIVALFVMNMSIAGPAQEVSNYIMPVALSMASFYVFTVSIENRTRPFGVGLAGFLLAIAIGIRLTYAAVVLPFVIISVFYPLSQHSPMTTRRRIADAILPFTVGMAIGLLPVSLFLSDLESFVFHNLGYHHINAQWRQVTGYGGPMSLPAKLAGARYLLSRADNLVLLLGILLGLGFPIIGGHTTQETLKQIPTGGSLAILLVLVSVPAALAPTPLFPQYFAMPVSFLFLLLVYSLSLTCRSGRTATVRRLLLILVLVCVASTGPGLLDSLSGLTHRDRWTGLYIHDVSMDIRDILTDRTTGTDYRVATLSPLFAVESNIPIYPELSTGPFLYRIGDCLTPEARNRFVGTSPKSIDALLDEEPPAAILVGFEGKLDEPLIEYAITNNYAEVDVPGFDGELYVRP